MGDHETVFQSNASNGLTHVMMTEQYGRAVFAMHDLPRGTWVEVADILVLNDTDTIVLKSTELDDYTFTFSDTQDCLVLGIGELFNHDDDANTIYELINLNGRFRMVFMLRKDVKKGDQLFIDYTADLRPNESKAAYKTNMI